jgi:hypothetical protein
MGTTQPFPFWSTFSALVQTRGWDMNPALADAERSISGHVLSRVVTSCVSTGEADLSTQRLLWRVLGGWGWGTLATLPAVAN